MDKKYTVKIYGPTGLTFIKSLSPELLKEPPAFRSRINGGLGELVLDLNLPFDDFDEGVSIKHMNVVDVYCTDQENPRGRRIYRGFISKYEPYIERQEGVRVTCLGLVSLLTFSYYKSGGGYFFTKSGAPETILQDIVDHFNTVYSGPLLSYDGTMESTGLFVNYLFDEVRWIDAVQVMREIASLGWWWKIDADGAVHFKSKPATATHVLTIGKDIDSLSCPKDSEQIINDLGLQWSSGGIDFITYYTDATSQSTYGLRSTFVGGTGINNSTTADIYGNRYLGGGKDPKIKTTIVVNQNYDLESLQAGHTVAIRNFRKGNEFFGDNVSQIVSLDYSSDRVKLELEELSADFGTELARFVSS